MGIPLAHVFGDSLIIINWAKRSTALSPPELVHWCRKTKKLATSFQDLSFAHIYWEHNDAADRLSKKALSLPQGKGCVMEYVENLLVFSDCIQFFWRCLCGISHMLCMLCSGVKGFSLILLLYHSWKCISLDRCSDGLLALDRCDWTDSPIIMMSQFSDGYLLDIMCHSS